MINSDAAVRTLIGAIFFASSLAFVQGQDFGPPETDEFFPSFSRGTTIGDRWSSEVGYRETLPGEPYPDTKELAKLRVEWLPVAIDELGEVVAIRGRLKRLTNRAELVPIAWRQGITVAIKKNPVSDGDESSEPFRLTTNWAAHETGITKASGKFEVRIKLNELNRDPEKTQNFRCAIALAKHQARPDSGPTIAWSSADEPMKNSIATLAIPPNKSIDETMRAIQAACKEEQSFEPLAIIRVVNALQPLGKEAALQRIEKYLKLKEQIDQFGDGVNGVFWVLRILFEPIELGQRIPPPHAFVRHIDKSVEADWPLNPIVLVNDIPFRFVGGGMGGGGMPEHPRSHIDFVRKNCVIRDAPLRPFGDPVLTGQQLIDSPLITRMPANDRATGIDDIQRQAILLLPKSRRDRLENGRKGWSSALSLSRDAPLVWNDKNGFVEANP